MKWAVATVAGAGLPGWAGNFRVPRLDLLGVKVVEFQCLLEHKQLFGAPRAGQRLPDLFAAFFATKVPVGGERLGVPFVRDDGAHNRQPGDACHIAQGLRELDVHLKQGFLQVQNVWGPVFKQLDAVAEQGAERAQLAFRAKRSGQQTILGQGLHPLGVADVALFAGHPPQGTGTDQQAGKTLRFQQLKKRAGNHACPEPAEGVHRGRRKRLRQCLVRLVCLPFRSILCPCALVSPVKNEWLRQNHDFANDS
jgi:hypothetical protein